MTATDARPRHRDVHQRQRRRGALALLTGGVMLAAAAGLSSCDPQQPAPQSTAAGSSSAGTSQSAPIESELKDGRLAVPGPCAAFSQLPGTPGKNPDAAVPDTVDADFTAGTASGTDGRASVAIRSVTPGELTGIPVTVVTFTCFDGSAHSHDAFGLYGPGAAYLGGADLTDLTVHDLRASLSDPQLRGLALAGDSVSFEMAEIRVWGDEACADCAGSGTADVTMTLEHGSLTVTDAVFRTSSGRSRMVTDADVQAQADRLAAGDIAGVRAVSEPEMMEWFDVITRESSEDPAQERAYWADYFPPDACVDHCELLGATPATAEATYYFTNGKQLLNAGNSLETATPGDIVCGITSQSVEEMSPEQDMYMSVLVLAGNDRGDVRIRAHIAQLYND